MTLAGDAVPVVYRIGGAVFAVVIRLLGERIGEDRRAGLMIRYAKMTRGLFWGVVPGDVRRCFRIAAVRSELTAIRLLTEYRVRRFPAWISSLVRFPAAPVGRRAELQGPWRHRGFLPHRIGGVMRALSLVVLDHRAVDTPAVPWRIATPCRGFLLAMLTAFPWPRTGDRHVSPYGLRHSRIGLPVAVTRVEAVRIRSGISSSQTGLRDGRRTVSSWAVLVTAANFRRKFPLPPRPTLLRPPAP